MSALGVLMRDFVMDCNIFSTRDVFWLLTELPVFLDYFIFVEKYLCCMKIEILCIFVMKEKRMTGLVS